MATLNITIDQGADFQRLLTIRDELNNPIDLTGYTFRAQIREAFAAPVALADFSFTILNQTTNRGQVNWNLADTALVNIPIERTAKYRYDVEMESAGGIKTRILEGEALVTPEVTKT